MRKGVRPTFSWFSPRLGGSIIVLGSIGVLAVRLSFRVLGGLSLFDRRLSASIGG
jgi:hypothetical protein